MKRGHSHENKVILVTGGAGFIGSHTIVELLLSGYRVVCIDNLSNSHEEVFNRVKAIVGAELFQNLTFYCESVQNKDALAVIFKTHPIDAVIHFAAFKAVGESTQKPLEYYQNNLSSTLVLLEVMRAFGCKHIIFSSSATVYGDPDRLPLTETSPKKPALNPYGWTKWMIEQILCDVCKANPEFCAVSLRYFNPIGAHPSGLIGEDPAGIPNNLLPYIAQTAIGKRPFVSVYGSDYPTKDGSGVRDYIHVVDLAQGHVKALEWMLDKAGYEIFNLGCGTGYSVLEVIEAFKKASKVDIPVVITDRRPGDVACNFANAHKAQETLGWEAQYSLDDMCTHTWKWQTQNPSGYSTNEQSS